MAETVPEQYDCFLPPGVKEGGRFPGIVIIHGGGWYGGDKGDKRERSFGTELSKEGYVCISINYLLAEVGRPSWPRNLYDCKEAVQFLRAHADRHKVDGDRIGVIGGSSGGHLAAMVGLIGPEAGLEPAGAYKGVSSSVQAVVALYGIHDLVTYEQPAERFVDMFMGTAKEDDPESWRLASPVNHISAGAPPFLLIHGAADAVVPVRQSADLDKLLREEGVEGELVIIDGAGHSFDLQPEQRDLRLLVSGFFNKHLR